MPLRQDGSQSALPEGNGNGDQLHILLVEDNAGDVFLVRRAIEKQGLKHEISVAGNGEIALQMLQDCAPDLILLDLNLPKVTGAQVLLHLRNTTAFAKTPVIIITSSDSLSDRERAIELGANAYFRKPTDLQSFMLLGRVVEQVAAAR
jgi:CheY-like chemotaxis protein